MKLWEWKIQYRYPSMIKKASKLKVNKQCFVEKDLCGRFSDLKSNRELMINQKMLYQMGDNNEVIIAKEKWKLVQFEIERLSQFNQTNPINFYIVQFE